MLLFQGTHSVQTDLEEAEVLSTAALLRFNGNREHVIFAKGMLPICKQVRLERIIQV